MPGAVLSTQYNNEHEELVPSFFPLTACFLTIGEITVVA